jgi:hypothetical protein
MIVCQWWAQRDLNPKPTDAACSGFDVHSGPPITGRFGISSINKPNKDCQIQNLLSNQLCDFLDTVIHGHTQRFDDCLIV